jgi:hypothetical protein
MRRLFSNFMHNAVFLAAGNVDPRGFGRFISRATG